MNDVLAGAGLDGFGPGMAKVQRGAEEFDGFAKAGGGPGFYERTEFSGGFIHGTEPEAEGHAAVGAEGINGQRERGSLAVDGGMFKKQGLATAGFFHFAIGDFGDFQLGGDGMRDAAE